MQKTLINPETLAKPTGYAHGVLTHGGRLLFLAGQTGMDTTGKIPSPHDMVAQFTQTLANLKAVVDSSGGSMTDIVKLTIFVTDKVAYRAQRERIGQAYRLFFGYYFPAMTLVEVKSLYDNNAMVEIDGLAVIPTES